MTHAMPSAASADHAEELAELGRDLVAAALLRGDFVLSSGARSDYYLDKYRFETDPSILRRVARFLAPLIPEGTTRIAGTELGAVALAAALSLETDLPFVIVRRAAKEYSTANVIEGRFGPDDTIVVIEDVVTSGAQSIKAADRVRDAGPRVSGILAVVDREEGGSEAIEASGYAFRALFGRRELGI